MPGPANPASSLRRGDLLLVNPAYPPGRRSHAAKHCLAPALGLASIAGTTPPGWRLRHWDENLRRRPPPLHPVPEVVGITVVLTTAARAFHLAGRFRARGARVVLGGLHVSTCPDECAPHADVLVTGEGASVWPQVLADIRAGAPRARYHGSHRSPPFYDLPAPRRDILSRRSFLTTSSLLATRGCDHRCDFCYLSSPALRMPCQKLRPQEVVRQIREERQPFSVFLDNNLGAHRPYLRALCRALEPLHHIWSAAVTIDLADDPALVGAMARAGCTGVFVGLETLGGGNRSARLKASPGAHARRVRTFQHAGIQVNGSFILGFDHDRPDVFARTVDWLEEVRLESATFHILTPFPGTPLFRRLEREGRLLHRDWSRYDTAHAVFRPRHMTPEALEAGHAWCYARTFSTASIWRRRPRARGRLVAYLASTGLYRFAPGLVACLLRLGLVQAAWRPLVELQRRAHRRRHGGLDPAPAAPARSRTPDPADLGLAVYSTIQ